MNFHVVGSSFSVGISEAPALVLFVFVKAAVPVFALADHFAGPCLRTRTFRTRSHIVRFARSLEVAPAGRRQAEGARRALPVVRRSLRFRAVRVSACRSILRGIQGRDSVFVIASATRLVRGSSRASPFEEGPLPRFVESHFSRKPIEPNSLVIVNSVSGRNLSTCFVVGSFHTSAKLKPISRS